MKEAVSAERGSFCRNSLFLQDLSSSNGSFYLILSQLCCRKRLFLPKEALSAETASFCRKAERAFLIRKSFCRISAEIFGRKAAERPFRLTTRMTYSTSSRAKKKLRCPNNRESLHALAWLSNERKKEGDNEEGKHNFEG